MELYLMQHGACYSEEVDPERPLSPVGREQIEKSGLAMKRFGIRVEAVLSSPKKRAVQTAEIVARALGFPPSRIQSTELLNPKAPSLAFLEHLNPLIELRAVFVAGHLPSLPNIASDLLSRESKVRIGMENGSLLRLDVTNPVLSNAVLRYHLLPVHLYRLAD